MADRDAEKRAAAEAAAELVRDGDKVGLGTGSTVAPMLPALAARKLNIRCVATSIATEVTARGLGIEVEPFEQLDRLDIAIDGADQIDPEGWLVKGGGGAHTREKIVAAAADRFVVIASSDKVVDRIVAPIPLELLAFGLPATLRLLGRAPDIEYVDMPPAIRDQYQYFTQAKVENLRKAGYNADFTPLEEGVTRYVTFLNQPDRYR